MSRPIIATLFAIAAMVPASGRSETGYSIATRGFVPLACSVPLNGGSFHEFCNSGTGYRVYAAPSAELVGATLVVDGERMKLGAGETLLSSRSSPGIVDRAVRSSSAQKGNCRCELKLFDIANEVQR